MDLYLLCPMQKQRYIEYENNTNKKSFRIGQ